MLLELSIRNFAIIDDLTIRFEEGLTVLSGETGAGKSIIINAVNLILGKRASSRMIRTGCETAELEALFRIEAGCRAAQIMAEAGFDPAEGLVVRRIISQNDRHRIYINGRNATIGQLTAVTESLASISGQHANQGLLKEEQHLLLLDQFGGLMGLRERVGKAYREFQPLMGRLSSLRQKASRQEEQTELLTFQQQELAEANIQPDEDETLEKERTRLRNSEELYRTVHGAVEELYGRDGSIAERLSDLRRQIEKATTMDPDLSSRSEAVDDLTFRLEDVTGNLRDYLGTLHMDDALLAEVEERLDLIQRMKRKYGGSLESLFEARERIDRELAEMGDLSSTIEKLEAEIGERHAKLAKMALDLSERRRKAAKRFSGKVEKELASLQMARTRFVVELIHEPAGEGAAPAAEGKLIAETGLDRAVFMIAPNVGESLKPLAKIASGGELSRVVLALKAILAKVDAVGTIVFDEVDAGIGGVVADAVGEKMTALAGVHQVICITHLAQIAKFAHHHFMISKHTQGGRTATRIRLLTETERVEEIARITGGSHVTASTLEHAREMLQKARAVHGEGGGGPASTGT